MLSDEERKALEQARSNITRGNDIESAMLILEKCALDGVIFTGGRLNIFKIAVRQILNFLEEYKDKGYLDVVREKVKANETVEKQSKEIDNLKLMIGDEETFIQFGEIIGEKKVKDKIKAKIEELIKERNKLNFESDCMLIDDIDNKIEALQSLLDKEE